MNRLTRLERDLAALFSPRAPRAAKAPSRRCRLQAKQAVIEAAANEAFASGDADKGRRLDEAAFRAWRAWQYLR